MGRIYRPAYTRSLPSGVQISEADGKKFIALTINGECRRCEVREVKGRLRVFVILDDRWAVEWTDEHGRLKHKTVGPNRKLAIGALARYEERAARLKHGLPDLRGQGEERSRPIVLAINEYLEVLAAQDTSQAYRQHVRARLLAIMQGCVWQTWADVRPDSLTRFLGRLRDGKVSRSPATINGYLRNAKGFANWVAERNNERSPLKGVKGYAEQRERRRSRRILTDEEFDRLLEATRAAPRRHNTIIRPADRAMLYLVAAYTGLRASELARLKPGSFDLAACEVTVFGKGKREERTPIPAHLAEQLRPWLAGKKAGALWPGKWAEHRHQILWLRRDAKRAGIVGPVLFHNLRRRYVTALLRGGISPHVVRRMARHQDLRTTMDYYAELSPDDLRAAAESLKPPRAG